MIAFFYYNSPVGQLRAVGIDCNRQQEERLHSVGFGWAKGRRPAYVGSGQGPAYSVELKSQELG